MFRSNIMFRSNKRNKKILIELRSAIKVKNKFFFFNQTHKRIEQYISGLNSLKKFYNKLEGIDILFVDNTLENINFVPDKIKSKLPKNCKFYVKLNNLYGKYNKGAGDIEMWRAYLQIIKKYDYFLHYEHRMIIKDFSFVSSFLKNPRNFFSITNNGKQIKTGCFGVNTIDFINFIKKINLDLMVRKKVSIEDLMYNFFKKKKHQFIKKNFFLWHDQYTNKYIPQ